MILLWAIVFSSKWTLNLKFPRHMRFVRAIRTVRLSCIKWLFLQTSDLQYLTF